MNTTLIKKFDRTALPIMAMSSVSFIGTACTPLLLGNPLALMLLSPRIIFMGLAAGQMSLIPFVLLASLRLSVTDPFHFLLGRRHGPKQMMKLGRIGRWMAKPGTHHKTVAIGLLAFRPIGRHLMWAGAQNVRARWVVAIDVVSTIVYCVIVHKTATRIL
ncbi:MAG: hypothetical protein O3B15_09280 [Actinomycetota bacterium]|nr:hypothetical protein [Actinomycetota bacterium]